MYIQTSTTVHMAPYIRITNAGADPTDPEPVIQLYPGGSASSPCLFLTLSEAQLLVAAIECRLAELDEVAHAWRVNVDALAAQVPA